MSETNDNKPDILTEAARARWRIGTTINSVGETVSRPVARCGSERKVRTEGTGTPESRQFYIVWESFRNNYPKITDVMLAKAWTLAFPPVGRAAKPYDASSISRAKTVLNYEGKLSSLFTGMVTNADTFFESLSKQTGTPIDRDQRDTLVAATQAAMTARDMAKAKPSATR